MKLTKGYRVQATTIKGQNVSAPTLSFCASFTMVDGQNMRDQITSDRRAKNASDQIAFCAFHSFLVEVQMNTGYMHATHA